MTTERAMGMKVEEIYHDAETYLQPIAASFGNAADDITGLDVTAAFTRPDGIGIGATGPMPAFTSLVNALSKAMSDSSSVMHDVKENVKKTAQDFARTDEDIRAGFIAAGGEL